MHKEMIVYSMLREGKDRELLRIAIASRLSPS